MIKRLAIYISVLVVFILSATTGLYFAKSKKLITDDVRSHAEIVLSMKKTGIENFLEKAEYLMYSLSENSMLKGYFEGGVKPHEVEELFLRYCRDMGDIQAMRLVSTGGDIQVFVRECENISGREGYEPINLSNRSFFQKVQNSEGTEPVFSDFERGHLPDATSFCPSMIRSLMPLYENGRLLGYLIVNFWGDKIGDAVSRTDAEKGYSFIVETNEQDTARNGVFLFHKDRKLEFANQFGTSYFFTNVYGEEAFRWLMQEERTILTVDDGIMFCTTMSPYDSEIQQWKVCTVLKESYFYRSLSVLRRDYLAVMFFSIILSILTAVVFSRYFMKPYDQIKLAAKAYSEGNFDHVLQGEYKGEINELVQSIRSMADSLKIYIENIKNTRTRLELMNRLSALGVMAGGIAHELNTPLNSIILLTRLVKEEYGPDNEDLNTIEDEAKRCVDIIQNLRQLAPEREHKKTAERVDLSRLVEKSADYVSADGIEVYTDDKVYIYANATLMQQMLINLIQNAVDACPQGKVTVRLYESGGDAVIEVSDEGCGIDGDNIDRIFDPFYTSKDPDKGMGLGLSLVHRTIESHGGEISVSSEKNKGAVFTVRLESADENSSD